MKILLKKAAYKNLSNKTVRDVKVDSKTINTKTPKSVISVAAQARLHKLKTHKIKKPLPK